MAHHPDVLIVGGGVIGLTTAYLLAGEGVQVEVVDKGELGMEASWAGAGIIPPGNPERAGSPYDQLRAISSSMFPVLSEQLVATTGIDNGYRICGGIEYLSRDVDETVAAWRLEEIEFHHLQPPGFSSNESAYLIPGMAQLRNPWHLQALQSACRLRDVGLRTGLATETIEHGGGAVTGLRMASGETLHADRYLIAAGAWSEKLLEPLGVRTGIHPVRGQIVLLKTAASVVRRILLAEKNYLVPREDGHVLIGSTEEPEAGFVKENTPDAIDNLLDFAVELAPALAGATLVKTWAGLRPGSQDGLPSIGKVSNFRNLFLASGHFRAGIQLSPATALVMSDLLLDRPARLAIDDFRPGRLPGPVKRPTFHS